MAFRACAADDRGYLVLLHREAPPTDDEWTAYLEGVRKQLAGATARVHAIVATDGGGPNANQRKQLAALLPKGEGTLLTHVFTTNVVVRGIVTAFHWLVRAGAVAHDPAEFASVCESLGLSPRAVLRELLEAQKALPPVAVLEAIAESMNPTSTTMKIR
jgi:hypothetical protein